MFIRLEGWPERLIEVVEKHSHLPSEYGVSDCWILVADAIEALTGVLPFPGVRGAYSNEQGAARQLKRLRFNDVGEMLEDYLGEGAVIPHTLAQRGDVGIVESPKGPAGCVFIDEVVVAKEVEGVGGLRRLPTATVLKAWKVGR